MGKTFGDALAGGWVSKPSAEASRMLAEQCFEKAIGPQKIIFSQPVRLRD